MVISNSTWPPSEMPKDCATNTIDRLCS